MSFSIRQQLLILTISILVIAVTITSALTIFVIVRQGRMASAEYRKEEMARVESNVKDYVDMAYQSVESGYKCVDDQAYLEKLYGHRLQNIMDIAVATLERRLTQVRDNKMSLQEAKQQAMSDIEAMRFDNNAGYVWINDKTLPYPRMIMHPTAPLLNGNLLDDPDFDCAMDKNQNLFQAAVEVATTKGSGFVNYIWPKPMPSGVIEPVKKLSYVYEFKEWGWVLGTGIYLDDARDDIISGILDNLKALKYNNGQGYFFVTDMNEPYPTMIMHPTVPALDGKILNDTAFNCTKGTHQNFFQLMTQIAKKKGSGYVEYVWPNPVTKKRESKLSYVRRFEPMNWVIGAGAFINHIEEGIEAKEAAINIRVRNIIWVTLAVSVLLVAGGYMATRYIANSIGGALVHVKDSLKKLSVGETINKLKIKGSLEIKEMNVSLNSLVDGINSYVVFAGEVGEGNLDSEFDLLSDHDTLGNSLVQMRNELKKINKEERERSWHNEGITFFNDLIRKYPHNFQMLCNQLVKHIARYMQANQCALYLVDDNNEYLELKACYAFDRNKHHHQRIAVGDGVIGQTVLEKQHIYLTDIPHDFLKITSGLGQALPTAVIIYPLVYNEEVQGIIEIASFNTLESYEIAFLGKLAESIASSLSTSKTTERTRVLLEETRQLSEEMKAQEEELRQSNEELLATQEEMARKISEIGKSNSFN